eukprot:snap_masked-scaffold_36-processed-gene-2.53-mRNA-1 protein AED:1.00 eAED:1.00 QI:0/-1/0/0/-1/1/1/0/129
MDKLNLKLLEKDLVKKKECIFDSNVGLLNVKNLTIKDQGYFVQNELTELRISLQQSDPQISPHKREKTFKKKLFKNSRWLEMVEAKNRKDMSLENFEPKKRKDQFPQSEPQRKKRRLVRRNAACQDEAN